MLMHLMYISAFGLHSVASAPSVTHVDFMSLDIEGAELGALVSAKLDKVFGQQPEVTAARSLR